MCIIYGKNCFYYCYTCSVYNIQPYVNRKILYTTNIYIYNNASYNNTVYILLYTYKIKGTRTRIEDARLKNIYSQR